MGAAQSCLRPQAAVDAPSPTATKQQHQQQQLQQPPSPVAVHADTTAAKRRDSKATGATTSDAAPPAAAPSQRQRQQQLQAAMAPRCSPCSAGMDAASGGDGSSGSSEAMLLGQGSSPWLPYNPHLHGPPRPPCDDDRLAVANQLAELMDAAPKKELENILKLVCGIFKVEAALIALFGDRRIFIINTSGGFEEGDFPWRWSFCGWTMASEQHSVMVINDTHQDARFSDNEVAKGLGVRFYCGSPLVASSGHRLGTLCFADTSPRVFDSSSLQILANFSELVTRELEKDIALARQQLEVARGPKAASPDKVMQYQLLLRTIDCVTSAVLLVDTSKPGWPVLHANSGWGQLLQRSHEARASLLRGLGHVMQTDSCNSHDSNSSSNQGFVTGSAFQGSRHQGYLSSSTPARGGTAAAAAAAAAASDGGRGRRSNDTAAPGTPKTAAAAAASGSSGDGSSSSSGAIGQPLWSLLDSAMLSQLGSNGSSGGSGGWLPSEQLLQQVAGRQSFTLRGVRLAAELGGAVAQLTFRCAGFSTLDGGVAICLPTFAPDASELPAAAAALSRSSGAAVGATDTHAGSLYFVTVKLHGLPRGPGSSSSSGPNARHSLDSGSLWTASGCGGGSVTNSVNNTTGSSSRPLPALLPCPFPQFSERGWEGAGPVLVVQGGSSGSSSSAAAAAAGLVVLSSSSSSTGEAASSRDGSSAASLPVVEEEEGAAAAGGGPAAAAGGALAAAAGRRSGSFTTGHNSGSSVLSSSSSSGGGGSIASVAAGLVCRRIAGLKLGGQIAAGSYGRVFRGEYFGSKVAVKVLDGHAVVRRDEATGFSLEALLSEALRHPNVVRTLAWAVVVGEGQLPERRQVWGETLDPSKPAIGHNRAQIAAATAAAAAAAGGAAAGGVNGGASVGASSGASSTDGAACIVDRPQSDKNDVNDGAPVTEEERLLAAQLAADGGEGEGGEDEGAVRAEVLAGQTWMVMEFCDKGCLQDAVERGWLRKARSCVSGGPNVLAVLATAGEIASGMALLHQAGIVHGDLSAFNVMLSSAEPAAAVGGRGFVAKVADFGLARTLAQGSKVVTKTYGTLTHMPPEVLEHGVTSKAADVYSFGVLLWQMVTGSRAWAGLSHAAVVHAVCVKQQQLAFPPDAPEALAMLGSACMAHNPADRPSFADILDILAPLNAVLQGSSAGGGGGIGAGAGESCDDNGCGDVASSGGGGGDCGSGCLVAPPVAGGGEARQQQQQQQQRAQQAAALGGAEYVGGF